MCGRVLARHGSCVADGDTPDDSESESSDDADGEFLRRKKNEKANVTGIYGLIKVLLVKGEVRICFSSTSACD